MPLSILASQAMDNAQKYTPKIDSNTHQDKNDELDAMGLSSQEKCYANVTPFLAPYFMMLTLIHCVITLRYTFGNLTTE